MFTPRKRTAVVAAVATASLTAALGIFSTGASAEVQTGVAISGLSVVKGASTGTTNLMITGTGFSKLTEAGVMFGENPAVKVIVLSDTQIATVAPPASTGVTKVDVTLTDTEDLGEDGDLGTDDDVVQAYPALTLTNAAKDDFNYIVPFNAIVAEGTLLNSLGGGRLSVDSNVEIGDAAAFTAAKVTATIGGVAAPVTRVDENTVTLAVPAGAVTKTAPKVVLLHDGVAGIPSTDAKYAAVISATDKVGGPLAGGGIVTITGKGFTGASDWKFGTVDATCTPAGAPAADTKVTCTVPAADGYDADAEASTAVAGPVSISFTPANDAAYGVTSKATWTYSDLV